MSINISMQINRYERLSGLVIEELRPLSALYLIETRQCDMLSEITEDMQEQFIRLGVSIDDLQI